MGSGAWDAEAMLVREENTLAAMDEAITKARHNIFEVMRRAREPAAQTYGLARSVTRRGNRRNAPVHGSTPAPTAHLRTPMSP